MPSPIEDRYVDLRKQGVDPDVPGGRLSRFEGGSIAIGSGGTEATMFLADTIFELVPREVRRRPGGMPEGQCRRAGPDEDRARVHVGAGM